MVPVSSATVALQLIIDTPGSRTAPPSASQTQVAKPSVSSGVAPGIKQASATIGAADLPATGTKSARTEDAGDQKYARYSAENLAKYRTPTVVIDARGENEAPTLRLNLSAKTLTSAKARYVDRYDITIKSLDARIETLSR